MKRITPLSIVVVLALSPFTPAIAQSGGMQGMDMKGMDKGMDMKMDKGANKSDAKSHHATGTVKSVDASQGTMTVDHQPVPSMNWPAMSMKFKVKEKKSLQSLKPGQNVEFDFVQQGKDYVITKVK